MHGTFALCGEPERRVFKRSNDWTLREHEVVISHWPDVAKIARLLPHRTERAIRNFGGKCNLTKSLHVWTEPQTAILRRRVKEFIPRKTIGKELGLTELQVSNRMQYLGLNYARRPPKTSGHKLMDAIKSRAHELNMTMKELDEACASGGQFGRWAPCRNIAPKHLFRAVKALDGQLTAEWTDARD